MELDFIQRQFRVFYIVGGVMLLLSAVVAVLLSKNLLGPVRRLADGTRNLAQRRFDTRIAVQSSDELGQLARDFNAMAEQLDNYEHRQKQWLSDISHELRTPLSVIIGEIEALQDGVRVADDRALASLYTEASHIRKIVSDLHDLSFAEAGAMSLNLQPIEPLTVLKEVATLFRDRGRSEGLDVVEAFASEAGLQIAGDRDRLRQVFTNICENAFQYTEKPGTLTIESESTGRAVRIVFEDTGPGVPPAVLPRLFDRLYRVDASRDRATGGSGLGLSICKGIIENHGGTIRAAAGRRGGLRIEIELPTG
jgi:two-component system sensor histidine kinase BaeS